MPRDHGKPFGRKPRPPRSAPPHVLDAKTARAAARRRKLETAERLDRILAGEDPDAPQSPLYETTFDGEAVPEVRYVLIDGNRDVVMGPVECLSLVVERFEPSATFIRGVTQQGKWRELDEDEREAVERIRAREAA